MATDSMAPSLVPIPARDLELSDRIINLGTVLSKTNGPGIWVSVSVSVQKPDLASGRYATVTETHHMHESSTVFIGARVEKWET